MATQAQVDANKINSKKAGVKTDEGKAISKYNAVRHNVLTRVLTDTEQIEAKDIQKRFKDDFKPDTLVEEILIQTMAIAYVRILRATHAEREFLLQSLNPPIYEERIINKPPALLHSEVFELKTEIVTIDEGYHAKLSYEAVDSIDRTHARYINTCERQFYRALHELQRVQDLRRGRRPSSMAIDILREES